MIFILWQGSRRGLQQVKLSEVQKIVENTRKYFLQFPNRWEREGASGWSYEEVLPYFKKAQTHSLGGDQYRGIEGPLHVTRYEGKKLLDQAWLKV